MAIEGGCKWIELRIDGVTPGDRKEAMRLAAEEITPLCRESDTFLILNGEVDLALELQCHGVHLEKGDLSPAEARERLGAGAIIGFSAESAEEIIALRSLDLDYATVHIADPAKISGIVKAVRDAGVLTPIVAAGDITKENAAALIAAGANGVAASHSIADADDPVIYTAELLKSIEQASA